MRGLPGRPGSIRSVRVSSLNGLSAILLAFAPFFCGAGRHPRVVEVIGKHAAAFAKAEHILANSAVSKLLQVAFQSPLRKQPKDGRNAAETTLVPASLSMVGATKSRVTCV